MLQTMAAQLVPTGLGGFYERMAQSRGGAPVQPLMYRSPLQFTRFRVLLAEAERLAREHNLGTCLEVGCCEGMMTRRLAGLFAYVYAVDIAPSFVARCPAIEGVEYAVRDVEEWEPEGSYDLVVLSEVLEHLRWPEQVLHRLARHARFLLVSVPITEEEVTERSFALERLGMESERGESSGHLWAMDWDGFVHMARFAAGTLVSARRAGASMVAVFRCEEERR